MDIINIGSFILLINVLFFIIDKMVCFPIIFKMNRKLLNNSKDYGRTRWYLLHIFINLLTTITSISSVYLTYQRPYTSLTPIKMAEPYSAGWFIGPTSPLPTLIVVSGHFYHILFFSTTKSDIYHHLTFAGVMGTINMIGDYGTARNIIQFVLSGFPGIIEYTIMSLYKFEYVNKKQMRYSITVMYCLLRFPLGILFSWYFIFQILFNPLLENPIMMSIVSLLVILNSTQYCVENIRSSIRHYQT